MRLVAKLKELPELKGPNDPYSNLIKLVDIALSTVGEILRPRVASSVLR